MKIKFNNYDLFRYGYLSQWCINEAVQNATSLPSTLHIIATKKIFFTQVVKTIKNLDKSIEKTSTRQIVKLFLPNKSQIYIFDAERLANISFYVNKNYSLYLVDEWALHYKLTALPGKCVDLFFVISNTMANSELSYHSSDKEFVFECDFQAFARQFGPITFPTMPMLISNALYNIVKNNNKAINFKVDFLMQGKCPLNCDRNCLLLGNALVVGNNCPYYADFYLKAIAQSNFSLIFDKDKQGNI